MIAEIILAILCIVVGCVCAALLLIVGFGSAMGRATNPSDRSGGIEALVLSALTIAFIGGGIAILAF